ncbi:MAG: MarC family protein [Rhizobiales bacterium]|nr:MarC family protein [Hyphomicrobiales bacterium]
MPIDWLTNAVTTLFVIIDPIGLAPIFLAVTQGMSRDERRTVALRSCLTAAGILTVFALLGGVLLASLGITLSAFRIAGGLLLFWTAAEMVFERREKRKTNTAKLAITKDQVRQVAIFPLAIPLMAGPGAISATVLLASSEPSIATYGALIGIIWAILALCFVVFLLADRIDPLLGVTGRALLGRLLGILLAALSVQFVVDGILAIAAGN